MCPKVSEYFLRSLYLNKTYNIVLVLNLCFYNLVSLSSYFNNEVTVLNSYVSCIWQEVRILLTAHFQSQNADNIPPGYEPISLLEALNGVQPVSPTIPSAPLYEEIQYSGDMGDPLNLTGRQQGGDAASIKSKGSKSPDG